MMTIRRAAERGHEDHGWLDSRHTFSFADYYDPKFMGFGPLRVLNEDRVQPGQGFGTHSHRDMEIISYVLEGALAHKDSIGTGSVIRPGAVQRMSAGTGVSHSEFNASQTEPVHFLQIWFIPERDRMRPSYEERTYSDDEKRGRLRLVAAATAATVRSSCTRMSISTLRCSARRRAHAHAAPGSQHLDSGRAWLRHGQRANCR